MNTSPLAGHPVPPASLLDVARLVTAYYAEVPDPSEPACATALEVLAGNGIDVMLAEHDEYTPTPVVAHAIST